MKCVETFLRIEPSLLTDAAPEADTGWLQQRGIEPEAFTVLRLVRSYVAPLVMDVRLDAHSYAFLVHGSQSGVPTSADDPHAYLHLRLFDILPGATRRVRAKVKSPWTMTRISELSSDMAGVNTTTLPISEAWNVLFNQSRWFVEFVARHDASVSDFQVLKHLRQFLHFFANMAQMRVA